MKHKHRLTIVAGLVVGSVLTPGVALAHGIGGRGDLPVPWSSFWSVPRWLWWCPSLP